MAEFEPLCHYPSTTPVEFDQECLGCRQDRSDDDASWIIQVEQSSCRCGASILHPDIDASLSGSVVAQNAFTVLSMQAGFALLEAGSVSERSVVNIMVPCSTFECWAVLYSALGLRVEFGR